jgi:diacylglycerol kinase
MTQKQIDQDGHYLDDLKIAVKVFRILDKMHSNINRIMIRQCLLILCCVFLLLLNIEKTELLLMALIMTLLIISSIMNLVNIWKFKKTMKTVLPLFVSSDDPDD